MGDKRTDLWYYGNLGDKEYNSEEKNYVLEPMNNCSKEKIVIMGYQIGTGTVIINGEKPNEYIEDLGELQIIYRYINDGNDLDIDWKWEKVEVKASEGELGVPKPLDTIPEDKNPSSTYTYLDKNGKSVTEVWDISEDDFLNYKGLSLNQIENICNIKNKELSKLGYCEMIYNAAQEVKINPKAILASLAQEQGWCKKGKYAKAFGIGEGGNPKNINFNNGVFLAAKTYLKLFNEGKNKKNNKIKINQDLNTKETKAVFGDKTKEWQDNHLKYVEYMRNGIEIVPVNAVMYAKLRYTPWIDFPPQNSKPLKAWHDIYKSF